MWAIASASRAHLWYVKQQQATLSWQKGMAVLCLLSFPQGRTAGRERLEAARAQRMARLCINIELSFHTSVGCFIENLSGTHLLPSVSEHM